MRLSNLVSSAFGALVALAMLTTAGDSRADNEFDVSSADGKVVVTAKGHWHINKDFPWKLTVGGAHHGKGKFTLVDGTATVAGVAKGAGKLKGALCNGDACKTFEVEVVVR